MTRVLRDYQTEAVDAVYDSWSSSVTRPAIVLPTGCGKTDVIAKVLTDAARAGRPALALAHRGELLDQIGERCGMHDSSLRVGRVQARYNQVGYPITVAMTPTLANEDRRRKMPRPAVVVMDECHHAASPSVLSILEWAGCYDPDHPTPTMGVTATLVRGDKRSLGKVWQDVPFSRDIKWAIGEGWLVPVRGRVVVAEHMDLRRAKMSKAKGDYAERELGEMVTQDVDQIVKAWQEHAADRLTVAFTPSVEAAEALREEFERAGVPAGLVLGTTSPTERAEVYRDLEAGRIRVMVNVAVATEGWDCPPVSCVLVARPTQLPGLYTQIVGRGLRPSPSTGKRDCLVLDVVGASRGQRLTTLIDLAPEADYDSSPLADLPCSECGGFSNAALDRGVAGGPCTCERAERDPDGGRQRLQGPAAYEDYDLLSGSPVVWLRTRAGVPFVAAGERWGVLWPEGGNLRTATTWTAGHVAAQGASLDGVTLGERLPMDEAKAAVEAWALAYDQHGYAAASKSRNRSDRATAGMLRKASGLGIVGAEHMTKARVSDEISTVLASSRLDA